ncbi:extracellular solute-binding protein [Hydrogenispora ethanolica]|uniref:Extracellular solute-binding protein n=1 Tax=Hydrogenispora ethanolica TaxID=1082276 RepID=A0A4V2QD23_HYDET|nr:ABC transporter substrate-binding protein [Hydrogenispora ethanolica]TCL62727.1 extracellular solute-binding protein [Hydrogenispora ethanolica]
MKSKMKWAGLLILAMLTVPLFAAVGMAKESKTVKITFINSKGEIQSQLEDAAKRFGKENPGVNLEIVPCPVGQSPFERVSALYAAGSAPTLLMLDGGDLPNLKDKLANLSREKWVKDAAANTLDDCTINKKVIAFPFTVEGYGLIYNKVVLDKAFGGKFDPAAIKTIQGLENAFKKVEASGVAPLIISPMDWSLAAHFLCIAYREQSNRPAAVEQFLENLKKGKVDFG